jgi:hypothetical protein
LVGRIDAARIEFIDIGHQAETRQSGTEPVCVWIPQMGAGDLLAAIDFNQMIKRNWWHIADSSRRINHPVAFSILVHLYLDDARNSFTSLHRSLRIRYADANEPLSSRLSVEP